MSAVDDFLEGGPEAAGLDNPECDESVADGGEDITGDWGKGARTVSADPRETSFGTRTAVRCANEEWGLIGA